MNPVATTAQRRKTLRNIRHIEADMLRPGWDKGLEHQFGQALTTPQPAGGSEEQEPADLAKPRQKPCPPGLCTLQNPACAGHCQYRAAAMALASERQAMPPPTTRRQRLQKLAEWLAVAAVVAGLAITWIYHP